MTDFPTFPRIPPVRPMLRERAEDYAVGALFAIHSMDDVPAAIAAAYIAGHNGCADNMPRENDGE